MLADHAVSRAKIDRKALSSLDFPGKEIQHLGQHPSPRPFPVLCSLGRSSGLDAAVFLPLRTIYRLPLPLPVSAHFPRRAGVSDLPFRAGVRPRGPLHSVRVLGSFQARRSNAVDSIRSWCR